MRPLFLTSYVCRIMPARGSAFALFEGGTPRSLWGGGQSLIPTLPNGDPLTETAGPDKPDAEPPEKQAPPLTEFPTDVPAPEPHDPPAWQPVDDPPPVTGDPASKPRAIP
jgi:hypothetical protein